jgi:hypothetical protein
LFCLEDSSVTSVTVQRAIIRGGVIQSPSARGWQGTTPQPPPWAEQCPAAQRRYSDQLRGSAAFLHGKAFGRINYNAPNEKSTTPGEGSDQLPRTEGTSRPRHTSVDKAAGHLHLRRTVYVVCLFCLKDSSITSVTVKSALNWGGGIPPTSGWGRRGTTPQPPPGAEKISEVQRT